MVIRVTNFTHRTDLRERSKFGRNIVFSLRHLNKSAMPTSPRMSSGQVLLSVPRHPACRLKAPPINITLSLEYFPNWAAILCGKMSIQKRSADCKRCCIQKCLAEASRFSHWQKMSVLPHHWRVSNLAENHVGCQHAPRALLFIVAADFERPLKLQRRT